jgi:type IV pilus assembly protein PilN
MIRINLIPYRIARRQQQIWYHLRVFAGAIIIALLLVLAAHTIASMELSDLKDNVVQLKEQNRILNEKIGKINDLDDLRAEVEHKLRIVDSLQEGRFRSLKTLNEMAKVIPDNIWLTEIRDNSATIKLNGFGESNKAIASFMRLLDQSRLFSNIRLGGIKRVKIEGLPVRKFNLELTRVDNLSDSAVETVARNGKPS